MPARAAGALRRPASRPATMRATAIHADLPPEFDPFAYVTHPTNSDVRDLDEAAAHSHYMIHGRSEGRAATSINGRQDFLALIPSGGDLLEIGPFCTPAFTRAARPRVRYLDALSTRELRARARTMDWAKPALVPDIDYVWRGEPYAELTGRQFDAFYSSHTVEHTPCLITHLREVASILRPGGRYFLTVPDKRYCFDHHIPDTTIGDVLDAYLTGRASRHSARSVVNQALFHVHNEAPLHWQSDHWLDPKQQEITPALLAKLRQAIDEFQAEGTYIDAHAWQFTSVSFRWQVDMLAAAGLIPLTRERVYDTLRLNGEFYAVLRAAPTEED